jgi:hypothetical protein
MARPPRGVIGADLLQVLAGFGADRANLNEGEGVGGRLLPEEDQLGGKRRRRGYARTLVVGALSIGLALGVSATGASGAGAAAGEFNNGTATAVAQIIRVAPGVGSLQLATTMGTTISKVTNSLSQAQAQSIDAGLIGTALTAEQCDGSPGALKPEDLPAPTQADNRQGDATASSDEIPIGGSTLGGGREVAQADSVPSAHATVTNVAGTLGPVVDVSGGQSDAISRVIAGEAREAEATVSANINIAGIVQLRDARWRAVHRTGSDPATVGTFSVANASVGDVPLPIEQLTTLQDVINSVLAASGITVEFPRVEHITAPNDFVRVTPLRVTLKDTPVGKAVLGPVLNLTRVQREQMFDQVVSVLCSLAGALLVGDIGVSVASGTGFMIVEIGGAEASSADLVLSNPFGADSPFALPGVEDGVPLSPALPATAGRPAVPGTPGSGVLGSTDIASTGPLQRLCETLHPSKGPGCTEGMGVPIGIAGLALTSGIAFLDWRRQRRLLNVEPVAS